MRGLRLMGDLVRALASLLALAVIVVAPPVMLVRFVGSPVPRHVNVDDIRYALTATTISPDFVVKALAVVCWIAWAIVVLSALAECVAWIKGSVARSVPIAGFVQPLVRHLLITASIVLGSLRPAAAVVPARPPAIAHVASPPSGAMLAPLPTTTSEAAPGPTCVVKRWDSLWGLAERHLGDGMRWREIYELNREMPQVGGRSLRDPDLILPGWTLRMPLDAVGLDPKPATNAGVPPVAETTPPLPPPPSPAVTAGPAPSPAVGTSTSPSVPDSSPRHDRLTSPEVDDPADDEFPVPAAVAGATLLAAGLILTVDRLRRRQMRRRTVGHTIPRPSHHGRAAERLFRAGAASKPAHRLDLALRLLASQLRQGGTEAETTRVDVVRVDGDRIEILLTNAVDVPAGSFEHAEGRAWTLPAEADDPLLEEAASGQTAPSPALATIGHLDGSPVLVNLEDEPLVLTGDRQRATAFTWSLALELATNAWSDDVRVVVVGTPPDGFDGLDRIEVVSTVDSIIDELTNGQEAVRSALDAAGEKSRWTARLSGVGDAWPPTIVLVAPGGDDGASTLPAGVGHVHWSDRPMGNGRTLHLGEAGDRLEPAGIDLDPAGLDEKLLKAAGELIAAALSEEPGAPLDSAPEPAPSNGIELPSHCPVDLRDLRAPAGLDDADPDRVLVRILGPVVIDGAKNPIRRRRVKEVIVYLALHPEGVTDEQIMVALWPGETPTRSAFNQTVSRARAALGDDRDGQPIVPYVGPDGLYRPSVHLVSDLQLLEQALASGGPTSHFQVTGTPFAGSDGFEWAYVEGYAYRAAALAEVVQAEMQAAHERRRSKIVAGRS